MLESLLENKYGFIFGFVSTFLIIVNALVWLPRKKISCALEYPKLFKKKIKTKKINKYLKFIFNVQLIVYFFF